ncbi:putative phosphatase phospho2 [Tetrabaena socialis]|uniref:Putative phosphatase phospho2 n=1 Tax=Tetrabaena socialis TaxID=47790 RepID=A0A2J8A6Y1_9CHLO|nr:putative phosphatase phospho2 [Tetrabaena socialis]|eukprot:PNH08281.1 putative phosphatase phospho2 [Tetrabaena socialis]
MLLARLQTPFLLLAALLPIGRSEARQPLAKRVSEAGKRAQHHRCSGSSPASTCGTNRRSVAEARSTTAARDRARPSHGPAVRCRQRGPAAGGSCCAAFGPGPPPAAERGVVLRLQLLRLRHLHLQQRALLLLVRRRLRLLQQPLRARVAGAAVDPAPQNIYQEKAQDRRQTLGGSGAGASGEGGGGLVEGGAAAGVGGQAVDGGAMTQQLHVVHQCGALLRGGHLGQVFDFDWTVVDENSDKWIRRCMPGGAALPADVAGSYVAPDWVGFMNRVLGCLAQHGVTLDDLRAELQEAEEAEVLRAACVPWRDAHDILRWAREQDALGA